MLVVEIKRLVPAAHGRQGGKPAGRDLALGGRKTVARSHPRHSHGCSADRLATYESISHVLGASQLYKSDGGAPALAENWRRLIKRNSLIQPLTFLTAQALLSSAGLFAVTSSFATRPCTPEELPDCVVISSFHESPFRSPRDFRRCSFWFDRDCGQFWTALNPMEVQRREGPPHRPRSAPCRGG